MAEYYVRSGKVAWGRLLMAALLLLALLFVLGFPYGFACRWKTFEKIGFFLPFLYMALIGVVVGKILVRLGHLRNLPLAYLFGGLAGLAAVWLAWPPYIWACFDWDTELLVAAYRPDILLAMIRHFAEEAPLWSSGDTAHGLFFFYTIWGGELLIVGVGVASIVAHTLKENVYCEPCANWTGKEKRLVVLVPENPDMVKAALEAGRYEVLELLPTLPKEITPDVAFEVRLDACDQCQKEAYITVEIAEQVRDKEGNTSTKRTPVVQYLRAPWDVIERLRAMGRGELGVPAAAVAAVEGEGDDEQEPLDDEDVEG